MRLELLKATALSKPFWFKVFSCGRIKDKTKFMTENGLISFCPNEIAISQLEETKKKCEEDAVEKSKKRGRQRRRKIVDEFLESSVVDPSEIDFDKKQQIQ